MKTLKKNLNTYHIEISGIVQGVGFRPFIYALANKNKLTGNVANTTEGVFIQINMEDEDKLSKFIKSIKAGKPEAALIEKIEYKKVFKREYTDFKIEKSSKTKDKFQLISPDIATCRKCIEDISNKKNPRRYYYPFTNCTNCGPRFTIINNMPYDRPNTTMHKFNMCPDCLHEYNNPSDRRFHAQPNACTNCGPKLLLATNEGNIFNHKNPIIKTSELLKKGHIIAIKSLGGFQIACDATSDNPVLELRKRKKRPFKPFAVMLKDIGQAKDLFNVSQSEIDALSFSKAPIVLVRKKTDNYTISKYVSFSNKYEGIMLPYTPIHHLLFKHSDFPLIMTSGNFSEEPIAAENTEALEKLKDICDYYLIHNRDIYTRFDDSVIRIFKNREMLIRRARGYSPYPIKLDTDIGKNVLVSVGAHEKNTFCILTRNYSLISQHIGDLDNVESMDFFNLTFENFKKLFNINKIDAVAYDKHPDYSSTKFAREKVEAKIKLEVQHHKAHIASVIAENNIQKNVLGFAWDGTGYGDDGKVWGSEIFEVGKKLDFLRIGHLKEKILAGGSATVKKPYRMAIIYLYYLWKKYLPEIKRGSNFSGFVYKSLPFYRKVVSNFEIEAIERQIETEFNSPFTTSMGRFFDAASSLLDITHINSFEGEAAINLEMTASSDVKDAYNFYIDQADDNYFIDDFYIVAQMLEDIQKKVKKTFISAKFHNTLSKIILDISLKVRDSKGINHIALSGGVFQNYFLLDNSYKLLENNDFNVYSNFKVPINDGGISLGQVYLLAKRFGKKGV